MTEQKSFKRKMLSVFLTVCMLLSSLAVCTTASAASTTSPLKRNVYYAYGMSADELSNIDAQKYMITHICYAFVYTTEDGYLSTKKSDSSGVTKPESGKTYYVDSSTSNKLNALKALKQKYSWLKILLSVGGGSDTQDANFRKVVASSTYRTNFAKSCKDFVDAYGFDGIDLDWEHPDTTTESSDYTTLCETIRGSSYLGAKGSGKLLTIAFPVSSSYVTKTIKNDISRLKNCLDFWNLMTYDLGDGHSFEFIAPLYRKASSGTQSYGFTSVSEGVGYYYDAGVAYADMNLGVPFYGKLITNFSVQNDITFGDENSSLQYTKPDYVDIVNDYIGHTGWEKRWCDGAKCPYLVYSTDGRTITQLLVYDDAESMQYKVDYAISKKIGGMMVWAYKGDDSSNTLKKVLANSINASAVSGGTTGGGEQGDPGTVVTNEPDETPTNAVLSQNFDVMPAVSATAGDTTHGTWSVSNSNSADHATLSVYKSSSTGATSLDIAVADGRWNFKTYCGFSGATPNSKLTFKLWVPEGSTIDKITSIEAGGKTLLGETALTANAWNYITTDVFGDVANGAVKINFNSSAAAVGQNLYIDNFVIGQDANSSDYVLYQDFNTMPAVSTTEGATTPGTWSSDISSAGITHGTFSQFTTSSGQSKMLKVAVGEGRYTIDTYCGFSGAEADSKLTFKVWIPADSTVQKINSIKIGDNVILGETALTPGTWNEIETSAFGTSTSGAIAMEFYSNPGAASQCYYIDDFAITKPAQSQSGQEEEPSNPPAQANIYVYKLESSKVYYKNGDLVLDAGANVAVKDTRTMVPIRAFSFTAGVTDLEYASGVITFTGFEGYTVTMTVGSTACKLTKKGAADINLTLSSAPTIIGGSTMVPLRDATVVVGGQVEYNNGYIVVSSDTFDLADVPSYISAYDKKAK